MSNGTSPQPDDPLEAYLDGTLPEDRRAELARRVDADDRLRQQVALQQQIDRALTRLFPEVTADEQHVRQVAAAADPRAAVRRPAWRTWSLATAAAAAVLAGVLLAWPDRTAPPVPHFAPTPLAELYIQTVRRGFEPYYHCEDAERFAAVFARRQEVPLRLLPMPEGSRMLGLSYPGGLSRDTTAMLCEVEGRPVIVFVDRLEADQPQVALQGHQQHDVQVFRDQRDGLVFYEVSPFNQPRAIPYLEAARQR